MLGRGDLFGYPSIQRLEFRARQPLSSDPPPTALLIALPSTFYLLGSIYPPATLSLLFPRKAPAPMRAETPEGQAHVEKLEQEIQKLALVQHLRERTAGGDGAEWYECRECSISSYVFPVLLSLTSRTSDRPGFQTDARTLAHVIHFAGTWNAGRSSFGFRQERRVGSRLDSAPRPQSLRT